MNLSESLLIEVSRGTMVESVHYCDAVAVDVSGDVVATWGDVEREIYSRSSAKPLQGLPLLETGAAEHFNYTDAEVAFACASHNSEETHTNATAAILERIGLSEENLECGPHRPYHEPTTDQMIRDGVEPNRMHNNCSGKHSGFLATAVHMGEDPAGYIQYEHNVQHRITQTLCEMMDCDLTTTSRGNDGCGIPVLGMPLSGLALGMARMAEPSGLGSIREAAARRIVGSMTTHPFMVAGSNRIDTVAMEALDGRVALKGGAEGVHIAIVPERNLGIALKAHCGNKRASELAILWVLQKLGVLGDSAADQLGEWINPPVRNSLGNTVGSVVVREQS
jgi:L-asparaginase II